MKYLLPILFAFCFFSCQRHSDNWEKICDIENYIESRPDSALAVLEAIDVEKLSSDEERAKYALYMSMALDKNYIDKTDFEVLQPAIDYYEDHGSATDKLRTFYYQGRIFNNIGDSEKAMAYYIKAIELGNNSNDYWTLARSFYAQGYIYRTLYDYNEVIRVMSKAAKYYELLEAHSLHMNCLVRIINSLTILKRYEETSLYIDKCMELLPLSNDNSVSFFYSAYLSVISNSDSNSDKFNSVLENYISSSKEIDYLIVANAYLNTNNTDKALAAIKKASITHSGEQELKYYAILSEVYQRNNNYKNALDAYAKYVSLADSMDVDVYRRASQFMEERHALEVATIKERESKNKVLSILAIVILLLTCLAIGIRYRLKISRIEKIAAEKEAERYKLLYAQMEDERDNLNTLLQQNEELDPKAMNAVARRLELLNKFFTAYITDNSDIDRKASKEMEELLEDKEKFMDSNRLAYAGSHPKFIKYLEDKGLTEWEINYCCLYALGLKGKEVGAYIKMRSHYNNSSEVREKLGITEHDTNLGIYIRKLVKSLSE